MRRFVTPGVVTLVAVALGAVLLGVAGAFAGPDVSAAPRAPAAARGAYPGDFIHVLQVVAGLEKDPPAEPLVCLLGGSAARECTVSDPSWSAAVSALRSYQVDCVNLGSKHRLFTQDRQLIKYLPAGTDIVYIGVNAGRFCNAINNTPIPVPADTVVSGAARGAPSSVAGGSATDSRGSTKVWSDARKRHVAGRWMAQRWPRFRARWRDNMRVLARVCELSLAHGQHPVIIDLPRNMQIIGHLLDKPLGLYHRACRKLAARLGIPYVQFQSATHLTDRDFSDLWHTVTSGKVKWQQALTTTTARLIETYGIGPASTPTSSPSAVPSPSGSPVP